LSSNNTFVMKMVFPTIWAVVFGERSLYISNYRREIIVPLSGVTSVKENRWVNTRPITVAFREHTAFGQQVVFMPAGRAWLIWRPHPVAEELKRLVNQAGGTTIAPDV